MDDSIITPCSVKAKGSLRLPPQLDVTICDFKFEAAICDLKDSYSSSVNRNMNSGGKRSIIFHNHEKNYLKSKGRKYPFITSHGDHRDHGVRNNNIELRFVWFVVKITG